MINRLRRELQFTAFIPTDQHVKSLRYSRDSLEFFWRIQNDTDIPCNESESVPRDDLRYGSGSARQKISDLSLGVLSRTPRPRRRGSGLLREFVRTLEKKDELEKMSAEVDPVLEITEISDPFFYAGIDVFLLTANQRSDSTTH